MRLNDIRRLTIRQRVQIRFTLSNGMDCIINEHGVSRVPQLNQPPAFNLEEELAGAQRFSLEPVSLAGKGSAQPKPRQLSREELQVLAASAGSPATPQHDHEE